MHNKSGLHCKISYYVVYTAGTCPPLTDPNNGVIICSLGDDGVPSYEDTCSFTCNTGYELTGSDTRTCQTDGSWSGSQTICQRGMTCVLYVCVKCQSEWRTAAQTLR